MFGRPEISGETEPLVDVTTTDNEVKAVVEMPGISKDKIKINAPPVPLEFWDLGSTWTYTVALMSGLTLYEGNSSTGNDSLWFQLWMSEL